MTVPARRTTGEMPAAVVPPFYVTGGSLPDDAPSYVERQADRDVLDALRGGEYCYILDSRQVGKSSLMVRAASRLRRESARVVALDLSGYGQNVSPEQWYCGMLFAIGDQLHIEEALEAFWTGRTELGFVQRWIEAIRQTALADTSQPLIIFVDEIDAVRSLPFSVDEFFAAIRECHNRRALNPTFRRLTFCLLGVATPSQLIRNPHTTPFNIGRRIVLEDFTAREAGPLAQGLLKSSHNREADSEAILKRVLYWTGGHPYLTQRLCQAAAERGDLRAPADIDRVCQALFLSRQARETEDNLTFVRRRMLADSEYDAGHVAILKLYDSILRRGARVSHDPTNPLVSSLMLCGLVRVRNSQCRSLLYVRCRIYAAVFDRAWVRDNLPDAEIRRLRVQARRDVARVGLFWMTAGLALLVASWQFMNANAARQNANLAKQVAADYRRESDASRLEANASRLETMANRRENALLAAQARREAAQAQARAAQAEIRLAGAVRKSGDLDALVARAADATRQALVNRDEARKQARAVQAEAQGSIRDLAVVSEDMRDLSSLRYTTQEGGEVEALKYGLERVEAAWRSHYAPSALAENFLVNNVMLGKFRLMQLHLQGSIVAASFSPDDTRILTAGVNRYAYIWDARTGQELSRLDALNSPERGKNASGFTIYSAEFSRDGKYILTAGGDQQIKIWDARDRSHFQSKPLYTLPGDNATVLNASFSSDSHHIVAAGPGSSARIWDLWDRQTRRYPKPGEPNSKNPYLTLGDAQKTKEYLWSVAYVPDGGRVVTASSDNSVTVWNAQDGRPLREYGGHTQSALSATFSREGQRVISTSKDGTARAWDADTGEPYRSYAGHRDWVWFASCSDYGNTDYMTTAGKDGRVMVWSFCNAAAPLYTLETAASAVYGAQFSHDATRLVTAGGDQTSEVWYFSTNVLKGMERQANDAAFSPDGGRVVMAGADRYAYVTGSSPSQPVLRLAGHSDSVLSACFSPDGREVATAGQDGKALVWTLKPAFGLPYKTGQAWQPMQVQTNGFTSLLGHDGAVYSVAYSADGARIITAGADGTAKIWDARDGHCLRTLSEHKDAVYSGVLSRDGRTALTASKDGMACLWSLRDGRVLRRFVPAGRAGTGSRREQNHPNMAVFSPDERHVLTADTNHQAYLWDAQTGRQEAELTGHTGSVQSAAFSADGNRLVTAGMDDTARIWDTKAVLNSASRSAPCKPLLTLNAHTRGVLSASFSPDGKNLVLAGRDGTVRVHPATLEGFAAKARDILRRVPAPRGGQDRP